MASHRITGLIMALLLTTAGLAQAAETLRYAGATTLQRFFMPEAARIFRDETDVRFHIEGGNTGPGISALLAGEIDVAGAGRHLTAAEKAQGLVEHFIGWDVLCIVLNQANPVANLSSAQLQKVFSGAVRNWQELGGPDQPIIVVTCPKGSGMRSAVQQLILKDKTFLAQEVVSAIVAQADQQVALFPSGITGLSRSMVDDPQVKVIEVDGVAPTAASLAEERYPLAKPLALITRGEPQGSLARFIELALGPQGKSILEKNFVPRTD